MFRGFAASLALVFALPAVACGGLESGDDTGASMGSANVSGLGESGVSAATSGASGPESGASAGIPSGGSGALVSSTGSGSNLNSGSGMDYKPCGPGASAAPVSFVNQIMPIFQSNCSVGGMGPDALCHGDPSAAMPSAAGGTRQWFGPPAPAVNSGATLTMIYNGFVNQPSVEDLSMDVVKAGDPMQSFLWYKINGTQGSLDMENRCDRGDFGDCGSAMPVALTGATITLLPQADLDLICNWIVQGAPLPSCPAGQGYAENGICAPCPSGEMLCGTLCVNGQTDLDHCGGCGHVCPNAGFGAYCQSGTCVACLSGEGLCGYPSLCVSLQTDPNNCGECGVECLASTPACQEGNCSPN